MDYFYAGIPFENIGAVFLYRIRAQIDSILAKIKKYMTPEEIKEALNKSGYLFEQQVATQLEKLGFHVETNKAFLDQEEGKSREIDVMAFKELFRVKEVNTQAIGVCYLNCECKNSTNPLVFLTRNKNVLDRSWEPDGIFLCQSSRLKSIDGSQKDFPAFSSLGLYDHHFATKTEEKAVQLCKITRNGNKIEAQHSGVIEGFIYPLVKSKRIWENQLPQDTETKKYCKILFNLVVTNAPIYTIDALQPDPIPVARPFVPFVRELRTQLYEGRFLITFVHYDHLQFFIEQEVKPLFSRIEELYQQDPFLFTDIYL